MAGVTYCGICSKPVWNDAGAVGDVVDAFKYELDGALDYIELFHRSCAKAKGYKIDAHGHLEGAGPRGRLREDIAPHPKLQFWLLSAVTEYDRKQQGKLGYNRYALPQYLNAIDYVVADVKRGVSVKRAVESAFLGRLQTFILKWITKQGGLFEATEPICTGCMGTGIYKHEGDAREYRCPYCRGTGKSPYYVKPVKEEEQPCDVCGGSGKWDLRRPCPVCGGTGTINEGVKRVAGRFQVVDRKGNPIGKSHPSYTAAQKADPEKRKLFDNVAAGKAQTSGEFATAGFPTNEDGCVVTSEMSDTAPAVSKLESFMEHVLRETIVKHGSGYRLVSKKGKNLGDFSSKAAAHKHEGEVEWFKTHKK